VFDGEGNSLHSGQVEVGDVVTGKVGMVYAYTHEFDPGESVAVLPGSWGDLLELQLLPSSEGLVEVHWGRRLGDISVDDLAAGDCVEQLESLPTHAPTSSSSGRVQTQAASEAEFSEAELNCASTE
jgi:hypothetical protein